MSSKTRPKSPKELAQFLLNLGQDNYYPDGGHQEADQALLEFINDSEVTAAYALLVKWYA